ncbi:MAG: N-acetylmannosamine-6-phosphate 2-epimerase [Culicoidibacterales bacterium]
MKAQVLEGLRKGLIVSCQALPEEPLHSDMIMARMAQAAQEGGAVGIRANSVKDIQAIREAVQLPIIGIIKAEYAGSDVYITPTRKEVDQLAQTGCEIIALDATSRVRPNGETLENLIAYTKATYPQIILMADCATISDVTRAQRYGFDIVAPTLVGYTEESKASNIQADTFALLQEMRAKTACYFIAEGNINTPEMANHVLQLGADSVVVGSMITRPQLITKRFVEAITQQK